MVVIIPNFYRSLSMDVFSPKGRHSSEQAGLGEKGNTKAVGKYSLGKMLKIKSYCNCQPSGLTCPGNLCAGPQVQPGSVCCCVQLRSAHEGRILYCFPVVLPFSSPLLIV